MGTPATVLGDRLTVGQVPFLQIATSRNLGHAMRAGDRTGFIGRSTNGRSSAFDALSPGSNPGRPAKSRRSGCLKAEAQLRESERRLAEVSNLGFFWRQQHAAEVGRILDFAGTAAIGGNVEIQKREV